MDLTGVIERRATDRTGRNATSRPAGACRVRLARVEPGPEGPGQALAPARRLPAVEPRGPLLLVLQPDPLVGVRSGPGPERLLEPGLPGQGGHSRVAVSGPPLPEVVDIVERRTSGPGPDVRHLRVLADP